MYVVRRAFRNCGKMMTPGSIVEPGVVKRFKTRLTDGHIVEVNQHDFDKWAEYFKVRFGVDIQTTEETAQQAEEPDETAQQTEEPDETKEPTQQVPIAKVVVTAK